MLSVELTNLADLLDSVGKMSNVSRAARKYSSTIKKAIWETSVVNKIFAYETNGKANVLYVGFRSFFPGFGGRYVMDDANVPVRSGFS
jgi:meiotically up-regulated gene 157 (Mug157) protein